MNKLEYAKTILVDIRDNDNMLGGYSYNQIDLALDELNKIEKHGENYYNIHMEFCRDEIINAIGTGLLPNTLIPAQVDKLTRRLFDDDQVWQSYYDGVVGFINSLEPSDMRISPIRFVIKE